MDDQRDYAEETANRALMHEEHDLFESDFDAESVNPVKLAKMDKEAEDIKKQKTDMFNELVHTAAMARLVDKLMELATNYKGTYSSSLRDVSNLAYKVDIHFPNLRELTTYAYIIKETYGFDSDIVGNAASIHTDAILGITVLKMF